MLWFLWNVRIQPYLYTRSVKDLQRFLGFVNYYRRVIPKFAKIAVPLNILMTKETSYTWTEENILVDILWRRPEYEFFTVTVKQKLRLHLKPVQGIWRMDILVTFTIIISVAQEKEKNVPPPSWWISVIAWLSSDPKTKLLFYIQDRSGHRLCISSDSMPIRELLYVLHDDLPTLLPAVERRKSL